MKEKKRVPIDLQIPNLETAWDDGTNAYTGYRVEEFLKSKMREALAEKQDRETAITQVNAALQNGLNTEKSYRESADNILQANINTEIQERTSAITSVNTALSTERTQRETKDTELTTAINDEKTTRQNADTALQEAINSKGIVWKSNIAIKAGSLVSYNDVLYKALVDINPGGQNPYNNGDYIRLTQSGYLMMTEEQYEVVKESNTIDDNILYLIEEEDD